MQHIHPSDPEEAGIWIRTKILEHQGPVPAAVLRVVAWLDGKPKPGTVSLTRNQKKLEERGR
jgi:hypothetical protein